MTDTPKNETSEATLVFHEGHHPEGAVMIDNEGLKPIVKYQGKIWISSWQSPCKRLNQKGGFWYKLKQ